MGTTNDRSDAVAAGKLTSKVTLPTLKAVLDGRPKPVNSVKGVLDGNFKPVISDVLFSIEVLDNCEPGKVPAKISGLEEKP